MAESGWQAIGRIVKARRERLGLNQDELALYGGPKVATVGKLERAAQKSFPLRTQHQVENALGWSRGTIEQLVAAVDSGSDTVEDWTHDLVEEDVPDLSRPVIPLVEDGTTAEPLEAFANVFRLVDLEHQDDALRAAIVAVTPFLDSAAHGTHVSRRAREAGRDDYDLAADEQGHSIEDEQGHDETP